MQTLPPGILKRLLCRGSGALLCGAMLLLCCGEGQAQTAFRLFDSNIHRDIGGSDSNTTAQPALARVINALSPDVWTLQELGGNNVSFNKTTAQNDLISFVQTQLTIFGASPVLGKDFYVYVGSYTDGYIADAIVSRYPMLATQSYSDAGGGYPALRGLIEATINLPGASDVAVFTCHLKALNATDNAQKRQAEATANASTLTNYLSAHAGGALVVTGDFNETEETGEAVNWSSHSIGDTLPNGQVYHPITTIKSAGLRDSTALSIKGNRDTIDSSSPDSRFDYTLYTPLSLQLTRAEVFDTKQYTTTQLAALRVSSGVNLQAGDSASASDHLSVLTEYQIVPEPSGLAAAGLLIIIMTTRGRHRKPGRRV